MEAREQGSAALVGWSQGEGKAQCESGQRGCRKPTAAAPCIHRGRTARMRAPGLLRAAQAPQRRCL